MRQTSGHSHHRDGRRPWLTILEVANALDRSAEYVCDLIDGGALRAFRSGCCRRVAARELDRYLRGREPGQDHGDPLSGVPAASVGRHDV